jgi:eukaryotic-like serine/threonine-protein kinase
VATPDLTGKTVSHYRIETQPGEGGMGVVYRARDLELNRSAAVKFLSPGVADEEKRSRFQQEALTASSLNHPHILIVYEKKPRDRNL